MGLLIVPFVLVGVPVAMVLLLRSDSSAGRWLGAFLGLSETERRAFPSFPSWSADRDRAHAARDIAQKYGLTYVGDSKEEMERIAHFFLFRHKPPGVVEELVVRESPAIREALFTYYDRPRWRSTFAHFTSARLDLPEFRLSGRGFPHRDRTAPPIAFDDLPEFTASYEVRGQDETRIRGVLDRFVRTRLAVHGECWIEGKGSELLCGRSVDYTKAGERDAFFLVAREIRALFEKG